MTCVRADRSWTIDSTASASPPSAAASAARRTWVARPEVIERESTTRTSMLPSRALAPFCAACMVADRPEDRLMQTMASAPRSAWRRNAASNASGRGGRPSRAARWTTPTCRRTARPTGRRRRVLDRAGPDRQRHHLDPQSLASTASGSGGRVSDDSHRHGGRPTAREWHLPRGRQLRRDRPPARCQAGSHRRRQAAQAAGRGVGRAASGDIGHRADARRRSRRHQVARSRSSANGGPTRQPNSPAPIESTRPTPVTAVDRMSNVVRSSSMELSGLLTVMPIGNAPEVRQHAGRRAG